MTRNGTGDSSGEHPRIPGYEILELIGAGGQGSVYRARQLSLDRVVAIKVVGGERAADRRTTRAFIKEARLASQLHHPNILQGIDVGCREGLWYFVMEYVSGQDAHDLLKHDEPFSPMDVLHVAYQVAEALEYGHGRGCVHGDIKPENLIIAHNGTVKLVDYGIARFTRETSRFIKGTPGFMAPEVLSGATPGDVRSDLYSLGLTLYNLLTGSLPSRKRSRRDQLRRIRHEVDRRLAPILTRLLAPDPADRYQNPTQLLDALRQVPGFDPRPAITVRSLSFRRFLPLYVLAALLIVGIPLGWHFLGSAGTGDAETNAPAPDAPEADRSGADAKGTKGTPTRTPDAPPARPDATGAPALVFDPSTGHVAEGAVLVVNLQAMHLGAPLEPRLLVLDADGRETRERVETPVIRPVPGRPDQAQIRWRAPWFAGHRTEIRRIVAIQGSLRASLEVRIRDRNRAPDITLPGSIRLEGRRPCTIRFRVTDADGDPVQLRLEKTIPGLETRIEGHALLLDDSAAERKKHVLYLVADDGHGGRQTMDLTVDLTAGELRGTDRRDRAAGKLRARLLDRGVVLLSDGLIATFLQYVESRLESGPGSALDVCRPWLERNPLLRKSLLVGLHPNVNPKVLACLRRLVERHEKDVQSFPHLALAFAFAWSAGPGSEPARYRAEESWTRGRGPIPSMEESFSHYVRNAGRMKASLARTPWPLLVTVAANDAPLAEREWVLARYRGVHVADLTADFGGRPAADPRLDTLPLTLANLTEYGGGATVNTQRAVSVARSLGLPASPALSGGHCWPVWLIQDGPAFGMQRAGDRGHLDGVIPDPTGDRTLDEEHLALLARALAHSFEGYLDATIAVAVYELRRSTPGSFHESATRLLDEAIARNPYLARPWLDLADAAARRGIDQDRRRRLFEHGLKTLAPCPGLLCDVLKRAGPEVATFKRQDRESTEYLETLASAFKICAQASRPDLAAEMAVLRSRLLRASGERRAGTRVLEDAVRRLAREDVRGDWLGLTTACRSLARQAIRFHETESERVALLHRMMEAAGADREGSEAARESVIEGIARALHDAGHRKTADEWTLRMLVKKRSPSSLAFDKRGRGRTRLYGAKERGRPFEDQVEDDAYLCGFRYTFGPVEWGQPGVSGSLARGRRVIESLQPIYRTKQGPTAGAAVGTVREPVFTAQARDGYGVTGIIVTGEDMLEGFSLVCGRINDHRFNEADIYISGWHGGRTGRSRELLGHVGAPIAGILGRSGRFVNAVGLITHAPSTAASRLDAPEADTRCPLPSPGDLEREGRRVEQRYDDLLVRKPGRRANARRSKALLLLAEKKTPGRAAHYLLLKEGQDAATRAGDAEVAFRAAEQLASTYRVDPVALNRALFEAIASRLATTRDRMLLQRRYVATFDLALERRDFEAAAALLGQAAAVAKEAGWPPIAEDMQPLESRLEQRRHAYATAEKALDRLGAVPGDATAAETLARFFIVTKKDWSGAARTLAPITESDLRRLVARDQAPPKDREGFVALGQALSERAKAARDDAGLSEACYERAVHWYRTALAATKDKDERAKLEKAIADASLHFGPRRRYLVDLTEEIAMVGNGRLGKGDDLGYEDLSVSIGKKKHYRCLSTHPPQGGQAWVRYRLESPWRTLHAGVAINDSAGRRSAIPLVFEVFGDGRRLWASSLVQKTGQVQECKVDVLGVRTLELRVDCRRSNDGAHAVWVDPVLAK